jgi:hypothetical protein
MLAPGRYSTLTWLQGGQETGSITLAAQHDGVRLIYRTKDSDGLPVKVDEFVAFSYTPSRFGGLRQWLRCLKCGRGWKPMVEWLHIIANTVAEDRSPPTKRMADHAFPRTDYDEVSPASGASSPLLPLANDALLASARDDDRNTGFVLVFSSPGKIGTVRSCFALSNRR